jgi:glycosyltransferase involved in cell wall biosynthesis
MAPAVALLPWGNVIEDFLAREGLTLQTFAAEFTGSWIFAWVEGLRRVGVRSVLICVSEAVQAATPMVHRPTGASIVALPPTRAYRAMAQRMKDPYGRTVEATFGASAAAGRVRRGVLGLARESSPYLAISPLALARTLRRTACHALVCQEYEYPRFDVCVVAGRLAGVRPYGSFQGGDYQRWRLERLTRPLAIRSSSGLLIGPGAEAERVAARYGVGAERIARVPNPVRLDVWRPRDGTETRRALGIPVDAPVVTWHGRVEIAKKGLDVLLEAWKRLAGSGAADPRLLLIGGGRDAKELGRRIADSGAPGIIWTADHLHDPVALSRLLSAGNVYAFPSRHEGFPVAPIEAMACGLPVVGSDTAGVAEVVTMGEPPGGVLVPRGDAAALARALGDLIDDQPRRSALGRRARARAEAHFGLDAVGRRLREAMAL